MPGRCLHIEYHFQPVIPAHAEIQDWTPACAGATRIVIPAHAGIQDSTAAFAGVTKVLIPMHWGDFVGWKADAEAVCLRGHSGTPSRVTV